MPDSQHRPRVLFVDDEPSIRLTLPAVLEEAGFEVRVSESVSDALFEINSNPYDVLISDLNIGEDGDGFLVVSAMRHVQPGCSNFILTGYPAFETALQAIHNQVDDYLVKPVEVGSLIKSVREKVEVRRNRRIGKRLSALLKQNLNQITEKAGTSMKRAGVLQYQELATELVTLVSKLDLERGNLAPQATRSALEYGKKAKDEGMSIPALLNGFEHVSDAFYALIQNDMPTAEMMNLISDMRRFHYSLMQLIEQSFEGYAKRKAS